MSGVSGREVLRLLPRGEPLITALPRRVVVLGELWRAVGDGLVELDDAGRSGCILVRGGSPIDAVCTHDETDAHGLHAIDAMAGWEEAVVSAYRLTAETLDVAAALLGGRQLYEDLRLTWTSWPRLLDDLAARGERFVVTVAGAGISAMALVTTDPPVLRPLASETGVDFETLLADERATLTVTVAAARNATRSEHPGAVPANGTVRIAHVDTRKAAPVPRQPDSALGGGERDTFTAMFGVPAHPTADPALSPVHRALQPAITDVVADLRLVARSRLHGSSERVERILDAGVEQHRDVQWVADQVRGMSIRGFRRATLDRLADELLETAGAARR